jgi:addiction module RelB/DinJ family antitoxin
MKAIITLKTDKEVKCNAQKLAENLGLTLSAIVNASLRQFIRDQGVHFSKTPVMTPELERLIGKAEKDLKAGKNISPVFSNDQDMLNYLHS